MLPWLWSFLSSLSWFYVITILIGFVVVIFVSYGCSPSNFMHAFPQCLMPNIIKRHFVNKDMAEKSGAFIQEEPYRLKLKSMLNMHFRFPSGASKLLDHLYIGDEHSATNLRLLRDLKITHIINCAEGYCHTGNSYYGSRVKYLGFQAEDDTDYNMIQHFEKAYEFIEDARKKGGIVLIHCLMGINRSGLLAVAYIMKQQHMGPLSAATLAKKARGIILTNDFFQTQLIHYANENGLLELDKPKL